jgi:hypothetical protein
MTAELVKFKTLKYLLWKMNHVVAVTEYGGFGSMGVADCFSINQNLYSSEFEIKVSRQDLAGELNSIDYLINGQDSKLFQNGCVDYNKLKKLDKHSKYLDLIPAGEMPWGLRQKRQSFDDIPNTFSFVVPKPLVDFAKSKLEGSPYGLYYILDRSNKFDTPTNVIRPKKLHNEKITTDNLLKIATRTSSENLRNFEQKLFPVEK